MMLAMLIKSSTTFQDQWYEQTQTFYHNMNMEPYSSLSFLFFLFLLLIDQPSNCQQDYLSTKQLDCSGNRTASISRGYLCSGRRMSCQAFLTFIALPPYTSPINIAYLLGSEASSITLANNVSSPNDIIPTEKLIIVPISCSCSGSIYQHSALYTIKDRNDTYFTIANNTYQGLTTCQALMGQNYYNDEDLQAGAQVTVPLRCACPSQNQTANGVISLLAYMVTWGDTVSSIASLFGVDAPSILEANRLSEDSIIFPFTPLLIPLRIQSCLTNPENFFCHCPNGYLADGESGLQCTPNRKRFPLRLVTLLGIGIAFGLLCVFFFFYKLYERLKRRRNRVLKEKMFEKNGGLLLQQRLSSHGGSERAKLFTAEDLERATDNYNPNRFLGQGGYGTVFKGMLPDGSIVAVKRSKTIDRSQIEQFINEVVILSQINHRNIVKLLGCCLETEFPLLVYEFISNGNLSHHIHEQDQESSLPWVDRFRIAGEVAGAVAYMHSAASLPIFHRDIKSSNILLDDNYSAKVSDFGTSRSVPSDRTHLTTVVQGTFGYLDPEYFHTSQFTDKSDVYSFGVVLAELLTGEKPISFARAEEGKNLAVHFISSVKENLLFDILDPRVAREARREDIQAIAELAMRCLRLNGKKRPTMKEVSMELDGLRKSQSSLQIDIEPALLNDEVPFRRTGSQPEDLCTDNDISFSIELQPASI